VPRAPADDHAVPSTREGRAEALRGGFPLDHMAEDGHGPWTSNGTTNGRGSVRVKAAPGCRLCGDRDGPVDRAARWGRAASRCSARQCLPPGSASWGRLEQHRVVRLARIGCATGSERVAPIARRAERSADPPCGTRRASDHRRPSPRHGLRSSDALHAARGGRPIIDAPPCGARRASDHRRPSLRRAAGVRSSTPLPAARGGPPIIDAPPCGARRAGRVSWLVGLGWGLGREPKRCSGPFRSGRVCRPAPSDGEGRGTRKGRSAGGSGRATRSGRPRPARTGGRTGPAQWGREAAGWRAAGLEAAGWRRPGWRRPVGGGPGESRRPARRRATRPGAWTHRRRAGRPREGRCRWPFTSGR
jgi:hypothetical protein